MLKLDRLMLAMAEHEGWLAPDGAAHPNGSVSYQNNNPGNLRGSPFPHTMRFGFCCFESEAEGWSALRWDLTVKCNGTSGGHLKPDSTLADLINVYAPSADNNDTNAYLQAILTMTGFPSNMRLGSLLEPSATT